MTKTPTVTIRREDVGHVSPCPEPDIASRSDTVEEARASLQEAKEP